MPYSGSAAWNSMDSSFGRDESDRAALVADGIDQDLAPPAEADDRCADHAVFMARLPSTKAAGPSPRRRGWVA
jgi:hypothetical protein